MVVARITVLSLALVLAALFFAKGSLVAQIHQLEGRWAASLSQPSAPRREALRRAILQSGAALRREGSQTVVAFSGPEENFVALSNRLMGEGLSWQHWSGERLSASSVKGLIALKSL